MLSVKLFLFSYTQEAGHRLPAACGWDFWELVPFCPEGGREIGVISCEAQRVQGEDGYLGEHGNTGQPGFSSAGPQNGWNYVKFESFISMSLIEYQCVNNLKYTFHTHSRQLLGVFCEKQPQDNNFTYSIECGSMNWDGRVKCYSSLCISLRNCSCTAVRCVVLTLIPSCSYLSRCIVTKMYTWRKCWLSLFCYNVPQTLLGSPIRQTYEVWDALKSELKGERNLWAVFLSSLWGTSYYLDNVHVSAHNDANFLNRLITRPLDFAKLFTPAVKMTNWQISVSWTVGNQCELRWNTWTSKYTFIILLWTRWENCTWSSGSYLHIAHCIIELTGTSIMKS